MPRTFRATVSLAFALVIVAISTLSAREYRAIVRDRAAVRELRQELAMVRRRLAAITVDRERRAPAPLPVEAKPVSTAALVSPDMARSIRSLLERQAELKRWFAVNPAQRIPELRFVTGQEWLSETQQANLDTVDGIRRAAARIRRCGLISFAKRLGTALNGYVAAHDGALPPDISALAPYLPLRDDVALLGRYEMLLGGFANTAIARCNALGLKAAAIVDPDYDAVSFVGTQEVTVAVSQMPEYRAALGRAQVAYAEANGGRLQVSAQALVPYFVDARDAQKAATYWRAYQNEIRTGDFPKPDSYFNTTTMDPVPKS